METMDQEIIDVFAPKKTATGLLLMVIGLAVIALTSSATVPYGLAHPSVEAMLQGGTPGWLNTLSCLTPLAALLEVVGLFMVAGESKKIGTAHNRTAWLAVIIFVLSVILLVVVMLVQVGSSTSGSLSMARLGGWVGAFSGILAMVGTVLLVYNLAGAGLQKALLGLGILSVLNTLGVTLVSMSQYQMYQMDIVGRTMYVPSPYMGGIYPVLAIAGLVFSWVQVALYVAVLLRVRGEVSRASLHSVV